jgi:hypothetical protein
MADNDQTAADYRETLTRGAVAEAPVAMSARAEEAVSEPFSAAMG